MRGIRMPDTEHDIVVIGAGVVGLAIALTLLLQQRRPLVLDRQPPGMGCSWGNAGIIATCEISPLASLQTLVRVPRMLIDPLGPLAIRPRYIPALMPWLARYACSITPSARKRAADALTALNMKALGAHRTLLEAAEARHELIERGMLKVVNTTAHLADLHEEAREFRQRDGRTETLGADEIGELETTLRGRTCGGAFFPDVAHVTDPYRISAALANRLMRGGAQIKTSEVKAVLTDERGCTIVTAGSELRARQCVIAGGVRSKSLVEHFGLHAPIEAERGYHFSLPSPGIVVTRPIYFHAESFVATPLVTGLRLAGTAEFAGTTAAADWRRADVLLPLARRYLTNLDASAGTRWMGHRPSFPDSLPALGRIPDAPRVLYAFGHQHLGLTQAAISAQCIAALANDRQPPVELAPFSLQRFD